MLATDGSAPDSVLAVADATTVWNITRADWHAFALSNSAEPDDKAPFADMSIQRSTYFIAR
jgi:hypothetical protein